MSIATFRLSAFGDEIDADLDVQIEVLRELEIGFLELRGVWGRNVLELGDDEVEEVRQKCDLAGISISAIGSPIGKSPLGEELQVVLERFERILDIAQQVGASRVRVFSFYPPAGTVENVPVESVSEAAIRLQRLTERAAAAGIMLGLENEKGIVGDTIERCYRLLHSIDNANLRFIWDPANFVQVGEEHATDDGWERLGRYTVHVHVKDLRLRDGVVCVAGEGDGQIGKLLDNLNQSGFNGFLALEPHLEMAGHSGGFSGPEGMRRAVAALRSLMAKHGCTETGPEWVAK
jgi:sugar phosphate isomerase/epimerase